MTKQKGKKPHRASSSDSEDGREKRKVAKQKGKKPRRASSSDSEDGREKRKMAKQKGKKPRKASSSDSESSSRENKRKHYRHRQCAICHKSVVIIRRHVINVHVKKNERIPLARAEAIIQMSYHGTRTRGNKRKDGKGRRREICPLCDRVQTYLTTHLQRYHQLSRQSSEYQTALKVARPYQGLSKELAWDCQLHANRQKKCQDRSKNASESDSDYGPAEQRNERSNDILCLLADDLPDSETSEDEEYKPQGPLEQDEDEDIIPPSPGIVTKPSFTLRSFTTQKGDIAENVTPTDSKKRSANAEEDCDDDLSHNTEKRSENAEEDCDDDLSHNTEERSENAEEDCDDLSHDIEERSENAEEDSDSLSDDFYLDEEFNPNRGTLKEFYQQERGQTGFQTLLIMFFRYLQDIQGGGCKERQAMLHAQNVRKIKETLDPNCEDKDIENLIKSGGTFIWREWAKPLLDSKRTRPGTVRSYFCSVGKFCEFVKHHVENEVEGMPPISEQTMTSLVRMLPHVRNWGSFVNKTYAHEKWAKVLDDRENAVQPQTVQDMMKTKPAKTIASLLKAEHEQLSEKEFVQVRDFLIARLQLENGQRPGPIEAATLKEFNRAEKGKDGFIMDVVGHKNARAGPAPIFMSSQLYSNIKTYIANVRPSFAAEDAETVFVKCYDGKSFKEGKIGRRVTEWWNKSKNMKVSATDLRKMAASTLHTTSDTDKRAVHSLMTHKASTAEKYYMIDNLHQAAERGAMVLRRNLNLSDTIKTPQIEFGLTQKQRDDVDLLFAEIIASNGPLNMAVTRNLMSESMELMPLVSSPQVVKKVYDRVVHLKKCGIQDKLSKIKDVPVQETTASWIQEHHDEIPVSVSSSTKQKWHPVDKDLIAEAFQECKSCPKKKYIQYTFDRNEKLNEISERKGFMRCYEKVKNMFKKKKK